MSMKKSSNAFGYRTRDLPARNAVPQTTALPCVPCLYNQCIKVLDSCTSTGAPRPLRASFNQHAVLSSNGSDFYSGSPRYESRSEKRLPWYLSWFFQDPSWHYLRVGKDRVIARRLGLFVPCYFGPCANGAERPLVGCGEDDVQMCWIAANILTKQCWTADKGWCSGLWVGWGTTSPQLKNVNTPLHDTRYTDNLQNVHWGALCWLCVYSGSD
jgi:hypothetical protein